jgi:hypothetical protein
LAKSLLRIFLFKGEINWFEYFWIGLVGVIAILQIWSIFLPVNGYAFLFVASISVISLVISILKGCRFSKLEDILKFKNENPAFILIGLFVLVAISFYASQAVTWPDTLLYHLNAVKWSNTYVVVPGLANLHSRLGFNSSLFLFASMIDNFFLKDASVHIALPLLISVLSLEIVWILLKKGKLSIKFFCLLVIPFVFREVAGTNVTSSFSTDFALALMVIATSIEFLINDTKALLITGIMACLVLTIKLSGTVFFATIFLFVLFELIKKVYKTKWKVILIMLISPGTLFIPYIVRNIILSGWPFYPAPVLGVNEPWALTRTMVAGIYTLIHAWAISPGPNWSKFRYVSLLQWIPVWFGINSGSPEIIMFFLSCLLFMVLPVFKLIKKISGIFDKSLFFLCAASLLSTIYIFLTAPDFRFGAVFVWIFFAAAVTPYIIFLDKKFKNFRPVIIIAWFIFLIVISPPPSLKGRFILRAVPKEVPRPTEKILVKEPNPKDQFFILKPTQGNLCGNADLLCTPELNDIRELVPGDISKGFAPSDQPIF